jgi:hypothetical protein
MTVLPEPTANNPVERLRRQLDFVDIDPEIDRGRSFGPVDPVRAHVTGWRPLRVEVHADDEPVQTSSLWQPEEDNPDVLLRLVTFESPTWHEAQECQISVLADFQTPELATIEDPALGEHPVGHGDTAIVTRVANLVVATRNAGRAVVPVTDFTRAVIRAMTSDPRPS